MDEILAKLAAFPAKVGIDTTSMPLAVGCSLTWEQRSELLTLASLAKAYLEDDDVDPADDDDDENELVAGDEVYATRGLVAMNGREVPEGAEGTVYSTNAAVTRVDFEGYGTVLLYGSEADTHIALDD